MVTAMTINTYILCAYRVSAIIVTIIIIIIIIISIMIAGHPFNDYILKRLKAALAQFKNGKIITYLLMLVIPVSFRMYDLILVSFNGKRLISKSSLTTRRQSADKALVTRWPYAQSTY